MLLNLNTDPRDHSSCALSYDETEHWLQAIWRGSVDQTEAMRGAEAYLQHAAQQPCAFLLNDNSRLVGPWFESLEWLLHSWVPQAERLGLCYVAHVVQADQHHDLFTRSHVALPFELQIFENREDARHWLREERDARLAQQA
ncbi:hypothetical protein QMK33_03010 [Hymenobacter sp. H14-R3]|uniref:hypothetical protein n=1 Tax=Hymenobacter sp. H14-R3 TaxID=3046308 RepID=UPI0024B9276D|nr:hypothetical protein [Hymenobacter sp. H14-R3]MDJ0364109.1 hypothetical protein [Hymenobacter sp. H14-R3]